MPGLKAIYQRFGTMRDMVGGETPNIRAICAAVFRPETTASAISRRLVSSSFLRHKPVRPSAQAAARPADVRSRTMALEFHKHPHDLHHRTSGRCGGVDVFRERAKAGASLADLVHDV
jgi:hypothetical protein